MDLRPELLPPPVSRERLDELSREIERIAALVELGPPEDADAAVAAFNAATGHDCAARDFTTYSGSRSTEEFAREVARPSRPRVPDITRAELAEIVRRLMEGGGDTDYYELLLQSNVVRPGAAGLVFRPPAELRDASPERIVEEILRYRPIAL
ncbi:hypothetical protein [Streptomyces wuyuanensis]|uniref:hypothetical protein n=1 Tax=Streptomyces wuyuanensis TaxID=1196353 RepID=UPI0037A9807A